MEKRPRVAEITLSAAWHAGAVPARLDTADGVSLEIVHRGTWSHGLGPDFRDALILFDGRELRAGSIEIHLRTRGWADHGHHLDPAYDAVVLHLVGAARRNRNASPGRGHRPRRRYRSRRSIRRSGVRRLGLAARRRRHLCQPSLGYQPGVNPRDPPSTRRRPPCRAFRPARGSPIGGAAWRNPLEELLDGLGFAMNREPMREIARAVPLSSIEALLQAMPSGSREAVARGRTPRCGRLSSPLPFRSAPGWTRAP